MTDDDRVKLWDAINAYVVACGGDPSRHVYGNTPRMDAVSEVERAVDAAHKPISKADEIAVMSLVQSALGRDDVTLTWHGDRLVTIDGMFADRTDRYASRALLRDAGIIGDRGGWHWSSEEDAVKVGLPGDGSAARDPEQVNPQRDPERGQHAMANNWDGAENALLGIAREAREIVALDEDAAKRGPFVPHAVVHQHLAERAYAEDARFLFEVYQAAMRVREAESDVEREDAQRALDDLLARDLGAGPKP